MKRRAWLTAAALIGADLVMGSASYAQTAGGFEFQIPQARNYFGLAVGIVPDYVGSNDYTLGVAPAGLFHFSRDSELYLKVMVTELSVNLLDRKNWNFGPVLNYRVGRDDDIDDRLVKRMKEIDDTVEAGAFVSWKAISDADPRQRFSVSLDFLHDLGSEHDGYLVSASMRYFRPLTKAFTLAAGAATTYASDGYTSTYFGVSAADAAVTGLTPFKADSGFRDVRLNVAGILSFSESWHMVVGAIYSRMLDDAADSPVVDGRGSKDQLFAFVGVAYAW